MDTEHYEVRCCCKPEKVLGTIELPAVAPHIPIPKSFLFELEGMSRGEVAVVRVLGYRRDRNDRRTKCVISDDRELDFWNQVPGFTPLVPR